MLFMVSTTWESLAAAALFVGAALVAFQMGQHDAGMILVGFAGGTGVVSSRRK